MIMTKKFLAEQIIASFKDSEWELLEMNSRELPVSGYNRRILLNLREQEVGFFGNVEEEKVNKLSNALNQYLAEVWPEQPEAHKYVVSSCLALAFLYEVPMHPQEIVQYSCVEMNGKTEFFCSAKNDSIICDCCVARPTK